MGRFANEHEVDRWLRLAAMTPVAYEGQLPSASVPSHLRVPPLEISEQWRRDADVWLKARRLNDKPIVLIQAGNKRTTKWWRPRDRSSNSKYWPEIKWAQVIDALAEIEPNAEFVLCGVSSEHALNHAIARSVRTSRLHNLTGDLPLPRLLAIQQRALGMISVDTGPAHCAAAVDCPLVVLFGAANPAMYLPRSRYSSVKCVRAFDGAVPSMRAIAVEDVLNAWVSLSRNERPEVPNLHQLQIPSEKIAAGSGLR
ncbi:glycosyltransferase family 9 protein [Steroidobacter sp. S1-65]|uniref:Glycosyltransferase family 9 protein n=1 Tax=Steroidobacter gossypii TaxID=2805490 RepID=A0ABS1WZG8_9GAMM|nr:glycosyltransferase family 9 protein [Steroidobacter gossypii]MBM0106368.1 glycosyltransferase family 9 protein [Steroidobacter gossypii]